MAIQGSFKNRQGRSRRHSGRTETAQTLGKPRQPEAMAEAPFIEMHLCHDSGDCLIVFARTCFSCRRIDLAGLSWKPALRNFASATNGFRGLSFLFISHLSYR